MSCARLAQGGYLDEDPDEVFASVYDRLGVQIPLRAARDPYVWLRLEELKREPCDQKSVDDLAVALDKLGYRREAADGLYHFVKACGAPTSALHKSADIFLKLSDYAMAVEVADEFIRRAPDDYIAHYLRGAAFDGVGDYARALADYSDAIELFGRDKRTMSSVVFVRMAKAYAALGRYCEAAVPILMWVSIDPATHDTSQTQRLVAEYEQRGNCAAAKEFQKERYLLRGGQVVTVKVDVNGIRGTFLLDTGATYVSVKSEFAERAKIPPTTLNVTLSTANGLARGVLSRSDKIRLGKLEAANVPTVVQKTDAKSYGAGIDGLLGMSFLSRFDMQMGGNFIEIRTRRPK
ncbi:MAG TPA: TIGR02281 family clan AA aspartic protease [Xanthobacteraceae bacterium]